MIVKIEKRAAKTGFTLVRYSFSSLLYLSFSKKSNEFFIHYHMNERTLTDYSGFLEVPLLHLRSFH